MKRLPFFKFDTDDWLTGKIQCCTAAEKGTFIDLCAMIWRENGQLKITPTLERQLRVAKGTLSDALGTFSELGIMECKDDILSVKFITTQLEGRRQFIEKCTKSGAKGGRPKRVPKPKQKAESRKQREEEEEEEEERAPAPPTSEKLGPASKAYIAMVQRIYGVTPDINRVIGELANLRHQQIKADRVVWLCANMTRDDAWRPADTPAKFVKDFIEIEDKAKKRQGPVKPRCSPLEPLDVEKDQAEAAAIAERAEAEQAAAVAVVQDNGSAEAFLAFIQEHHPSIHSTPLDFENRFVRVAAVEFLTQQQEQDHE